MARHWNWGWQQKITDPEDLQHFIVNTEADGQLSQTGTYQTSDRDLKLIVANIIAYFNANPGPNRIAFYCHGGLVSESMAVEGIRPRYQTFLRNGVYPVFFIWQSTLVEALEDHLRERVDNNIQRISVADMLVDELIEEAAKLFPEPWDQMKKRGSQVFASHGGGWRFFVLLLRALQANNLQAELHVIGHSAGAIVVAKLLKQLLEQQLPVYPFLKLMTCSMFAPACTIDLFDDVYLPAMNRLVLKRFFLYTLNDELERRDPTVPLYHKSLLYLVSRGLEAQAGDMPILGMEMYAGHNKGLRNALAEGRAGWLVVRGPDSRGWFDTPTGSIELASSCTQHGGFSYDSDTLNSTLRTILNTNQLTQPFE